MADSRGNGKWKINRVEPTSECLTGRAGLSLFVRYLASTQMGKFLGCWFGSGLQRALPGYTTKTWLSQKDN